MSVCTGMPSAQGGSLEDLCIVGLAAKLKDTSLCKKVSKDVRLSCYALVAEVKGDPAVCKEAELSEDQCYNQYATDKRDAVVCEKIKDVSNKDNCYLNMAQRFGDSTYWEKIVSSIQKQSCLDMMQNKLQIGYPANNSRIQVTGYFQFKLAKRRA
ncbi:MAG: hypothetical protein AB1467_03075 [Candidatus Diapherotrites archaeon]